MAGVEEGEESLDADYEDASAELDAVVQEIAELKAAGSERPSANATPWWPAAMPCSLD